MYASFSHGVDSRLPRSLTPLLLLLPAQLDSDSFPSLQLGYFAVPPFPRRENSS